MKTTTAARARVRKMKVAAKMKMVTKIRSLKMRRDTTATTLAYREGSSLPPTTGPLRPGEPLQPREDRRCPVYSLAGQRGQFRERMDSNLSFYYWTLTERYTEDDLPSVKFPRQLTRNQGFIG
uniref:Uncharacterized protein n=1 Tax=Branchiostoma floridae TaxID=7739 RepID=C3ZUJ6_BRAFL|eukprot:XP_002587697.1 hypothetical protein BRAFLDRAFT_94600 [Branchiostoma floridae]